MKLKALVLATMVVSCQPVSVYPQIVELKVIDSYSFGIGVFPNSSVTLFQDGPCEHVVFDNTLTGSTNVVTTTLGGHYIMLIMGSDTIPDEFHVTPAPGYYVDGPDSLSVEDGTIGTITVCQEAMS